MANGRISRGVGFSSIPAALIFAFAVGQAGGATESGGGSATRTGEGFCGPRVAKDYLRPLARMASTRRVPSSGKIPFAPAGLNLEARGGSLVVGGGSVGFGFSDEAVGQVRHLNWEVSVRLFKVGARGEVVATLGSTRRRIGSVRGNAIKDLLIEVVGSPAFYRVEIVFRRIGSRRVLGKFGNYVRVVRPHFDARLLVSAPVVHRRELISARLANFGTETISSISPDWRFAVQRFDGKEWVTAASDPPPERHKPIVQKLLAGQMDGCIGLRIPSFEEAGRYRFSMVVNRSRRVGSKDRAVSVTAEFEIDGRLRK
jgi:hypothetical protein